MVLVCALVLPSVLVSKTTNHFILKNHPYRDDFFCVKTIRICVIQSPIYLNSISYISGNIFAYLLANKIDFMKNVFVGLLAITIATAANAQGRTSFGLKAGVNIATLSLDNDPNLDPRVGLYAGGLAHIHVSPHFAVQPEVVYSAQGFRDINGSDVKWKLDYINIPVMAQYMFDNGFRIETGPQLGLLASAKAKTGSTESDLKEDIKGTDVSWGFSLSYLSASQVGIGARYNLGLSNINESGSNDVKNRVFQVGLFYQFAPKH
jgi:hypothetical protein